MAEEEEEQQEEERQKENQAEVSQKPRGKGAKRQLTAGGAEGQSRAPSCPPGFDSTEVLVTWRTVSGGRGEGGMKYG